MAGTIGDELFLLGADAVSMINLAVYLRHKVSSASDLPGLRIGIHAGCVNKQNLRYSGPEVRVAAAVAGYARNSEILATEAAIEMIESVRRSSCRPIGKVYLNSVDKRIYLFSICEMATADGQSVIDPVCQMPVKEHTALIKLHYRNCNFFFCSLECARTFAARPERYSLHAA